MNFNVLHNRIDAYDISKHPNHQKHISTSFLTSSMLDLMHIISQMIRSTGYMILHDFRYSP